MAKSNNIFRHYWTSYGGIKALLKSAYLCSSIVLTGFLYPYWSSQAWWEDALSIMPSLLGFSLGGFAMWMAIGNEQFKQLMAEHDPDETSPFMEVNATFAHFILLQIISLLISILAKAYSFFLTKTYYLADIFNFLGCLLFIYSILSALAAVMAIYRVAKWYDTYNLHK